MILQATVIKEKGIIYTYEAMDNVLIEPGLLKLNSSILTIRHPKSTKIPEFTLTSSKMQEEHLLVPVLGSGSHLAYTPHSFELLCISIDRSPSDPIPSLFGS